MGLKASIKGLFGTSKKVGERVVLYAPVAGQVVPLHQVKDETFAKGILGDGVAILPTENELLAPVDARVEQVFDSAHAVTLCTQDGVELLMHIGIDTVELGGRYFDCCVKMGAWVKTGDVLIRFDREAIAKEGYDVTTPLVVGNSEEFEMAVVSQGSVKEGQPILELRRKEG